MIGGVVMLWTLGAGTDIRHCGARTVSDVDVRELDEVRWIHGSPEGEPATDPPMQVVALDDETFVIRQGKHVNFEAPFLYLLLGDETALLLDSGATAEADRFPIRRAIEELIGTRGPRIVVTHSHGHGDHWAGDAQFADLPAGSVAAIGQEEVAAFFGIEDWPHGTTVLDLGDRPVDVLPAPGHLADHVVLFDRSRGLLLSGDTILPGRLTVRDWTAFVETVRRLAGFARETTDRGHPIRAILGGHIELDHRGDLYDPGATYQPDEAPLPLTVDDLFALGTLLEDAGETPRSIPTERFVVEPIPEPDP
jgi:glyoxylase-like metal-dependent hydrolase (beta-lactamase superfamily II)